MRIGSGTLDAVQGDATGSELTCGDGGAGAEGDGDRGARLTAEAAENATRLAPRHVLVAVVGEVQQLRRRRTCR